MTELFKDYGIEITDDKLSKFEKYYKLLIEYNNKFNITAITEKKEVYLKHFIDSILGLEFIENGSLIDIGSGGGFPAIPLKILNEELDVTLMEATGKKCEFLNVVINSLGLKNIRVINGRAEEIAKDDNYREKFAYCTARAVARLNTLCEYCIPFVKKGGYFVAFKGDATDELKEGLNAIKVLGGEVDKVKEYDLDGAKRTLIKIKKIGVTDKKYPRGQGKERKNPL
ncbi:MAG: 16S rRNA (guanine(527)-N(7))-methyltransferase RsmG [Clostridiales bacterium]|nr:16S rRNA (guanine(527)-N(7))-methyltransferase RsmG [Clostridiales bacterium]